MTLLSAASNWQLQKEHQSVIGPISVCFTHVPAAVCAGKTRPPRYAGSKGHRRFSRQGRSARLGWIPGTSGEKNGITTVVLAAWCRAAHWCFKVRAAELSSPATLLIFLVFQSQGPKGDRGDRGERVSLTFAVCCDENTITSTCLSVTCVCVCVCRVNQAEMGQDFQVHPDHRDLLEKLFTAHLET